jgi:plastocyanin
MSELRELVFGLRELVAELPRLVSIIMTGERGNFTYAQATLYAHRGDPITWHCPQGEFAIHFRGRTPFGLVLLQSVEGHIHATVTADAAPGAYPYVVAVCVNGRVVIDACPEIIVEVPPTPPPDQ